MDAGRWGGWPDAYANARIREGGHGSRLTTFLLRLSVRAHVHSPWEYGIPPVNCFFGCPRLPTRPTGTLRVAATFLSNFRASRNRVTQPCRQFQDFSAGGNTKPFLYIYDHRL